MEELLNSIGKSTFVKYYDKFFLEQYSVQDIIQIMDLLENYTDNSLNTKASAGKRIFREHLEQEALIAITHAEKVDEVTKSEARLLLDVWFNGNHNG